MWAKLRPLFILIVLLLPASSPGCLLQAQESAAVVSGALDSQIQSLESIERQLTDLQQTISDLELQKKTLQTASADYEVRYAELLKQLTSYQSKVETLRDNYGALLSLSRKYQAESKSLTILAEVAVPAAVVTTIAAVAFGYLYFKKPP